MRWYFRPVTIVIAILAVGPLSLPLVWMSPALGKWHKVLITIAVLALTIWLVRSSVEIAGSFLKEIGELQKMMQ